MRCQTGAREERRNRDSFLFGHLALELFHQLLEREEERRKFWRSITAAIDPYSLTCSITCNMDKFNKQMSLIWTNLTNQCPFQKVWQLSHTCNL